MDVAVNAVSDAVGVNVTGIVLGLCGVVFMVAFDLKSIKGPVGILSAL